MICPTNLMNELDADFARLFSGIAQPDPLEASEGICALPLLHDNADIATSDSRSYPLSDAQLADGDECAERR